MFASPVVSITYDRVLNLHSPKAVLHHPKAVVIVLTVASYYAVVASRASVNNATISGEAG